MRLAAERGIDGVTVVYAINHDGAKVPVADFWLQPLIDGWTVPREVAADYQRQFAMLLVTSHNRLFTAADHGHGVGGDFAMLASPPSLDSTSPDEASVCWSCPIQDPECQSDCGAYGCGN